MNMPSTRAIHGFQPGRMRWTPLLRACSEQAAQVGEVIGFLMFIAMLGAMPALFAVLGD